MFEIEFDENLHKYSFKGKTLWGTTSVIKEFVEPFDGEYWSQIKADQRNRLALRDSFCPYLYEETKLITSADILVEWDEIRDVASRRGKFIHAYLEDVLQKKHRTDTNPMLSGVIKYLNEAYYGNVLGCEVVMHDGHFAGTLDLLVEHQGKYIIRDWKTNRQFRKKCKYNSRMLAPLGKIPATEYYLYTLQLNMYRYLLKPKYDVTKLEIVWFDHDGNYEVIELPIVEDYLMLMLNAHKKLHP